MAVQILTKSVNEKSTIVIKFSFKDPDGVAVTPKTFNWILSDDLGTELKTGTESVMSSVIYVTFTGSDLAYISGSRKRRATGFAIYDSVAYGNDLELTGEAEFEIDLLVNAS